MNITRFLIIYMLMQFFLTACGQNSTTKQVKLISWKTYEVMSTEKKDLQVLDVRTPEEFETGNIAQSVNVNYYADDFEKQLEQFDKTRPVAIYCKKGGRSHKAALRCKELGFEEVYDINGGYDEWKAEHKK